MKTKKIKKTSKKKKFSFILSLGLLLVAGYFVISLINVQMDIRDRKKEAAELNAQYEQQLAKNNSLQTVVDGGDKADYIEKVAREKLGYVLPDERVYYNITPAN